MFSNIMGKRFCENNGTTFVPKKNHADLHLHSANSLKEQPTYRHVAALAHLSMISSQLVFGFTLKCHILNIFLLCLATTNNCIVPRPARYSLNNIYDFIIKRREIFTIVLFVLLRLTDSDYPVEIFQLV
jgi:hypothetical protein